jgi:hypothetical protein
MLSPRVIHATSSYVMDINPDEISQNVSKTVDEKIAKDSAKDAKEYRLIAKGIALLVVLGIVMMLKKKKKKKRRKK